MRKTLGAITLSFATLIPSYAWSSDDYPNRSISVIVPWSAGGGTDVTIRGFLNFAADDIGQNFNVTNVTGGSGTVGWVQAANARANGYNLSALTYDLLLLSARGGSVDYRDFTPLITISRYPQVLAVPADSDIENWADFVEQAKASNDMSIALGGFGSMHHIAAVQLQQEADFTATLVPFQGGAASIAALLGGNVKATFSDVPEVRDRPELKVILQFSDERSEALPDVPTAQEEGMDIVFNSFRALAAPKDTPDEIVDYLRNALSETWHSEAFQNWSSEVNVSPAYLSGEDTQQLFDETVPTLEAISQQIR